MDNSLKGYSNGERLERLESLCGNFHPQKQKALEHSLQSWVIFASLRLGGCGSQGLYNRSKGKNGKPNGKPPRA